mgnify:CR=1 FL=1
MVAFPDLGIDEIEAKIDTGAYSSAIHAPKIWLEDDADGESTLHFQLLEKDSKEISINIFKTKSFYQKKVRSSNGRLEKRFIIKTKLILGGKKRTTHLSLTNREKMKFPVLIGRRLLKKGFLVDVTKTCTKRNKK